MKVGSCRAAFPRFYYDVTNQSCRDFTYGGCEANGNNFETRVECEATCSGVTGNTHTFGSFYFEGLGCLLAVWLMMTALFSVLIGCKCSDTHCLLNRRARWLMEFYMNNFLLAMMSLCHHVPTPPHTGNRTSTAQLPVISGHITDEGRGQTLYGNLIQPMRGQLEGRLTPLNVSTKF